MTNTYIVAEIGQNHNGSMDIAKQLIDKAAMKIRDDFFDRELPGVDAVKFTKRDLDYELSQSQMMRKYNSPHSFGETYGEHRRYLELTDAQHKELFDYTKSRSLDFVETICAPQCLNMLNLFQPDYLKVASRDLTNLPLLDAMGETQIPIIISTGMSTENEVEEAIATITKHHERIVILHCVSQYPAEYENLNLLRVPALKDKWSQFEIGYSDHSIGIMAPIAAVALGASFIEKHFTLDRNMKGSDHFGSVEPDGLRRMTRDIRNLELTLSSNVPGSTACVTAAKEKLERSLAASKDLPAGHLLEASDLCLLSPGTGLRWNERDKLLGKILNKPVPRHEILSMNDVSTSAPTSHGAYNLNEH